MYIRDPYNITAYFQMDSMKEKHKIEQRIAEKLQYSHGHHVGLRSLKDSFLPDSIQLLDS